MANARDEERADLAIRLEELEKVFERQMRARGFDPAQAENVALTSELARLYAAREAVRDELEELAQTRDEEGSDSP